MHKYYLCFGRLYLCISENNRGFVHSVNNSEGKPKTVNCEDPLNEETIGIFLKSSVKIERADFEKTLPSDLSKETALYRVFYAQEMGGLV